jgi:hypothetical protein
MMKTFVAANRRAPAVPTVLAFALPALGVLLRIKLCVLGVPLHGSPFDVGANVGGDGADGGVGAGAAGNGWPGGKDPYPLIGGGDPSDGHGAGAGGNGPPWWWKYVPTIPLPGGFSVNPQSGQVSAPDIPLPGGFGINPNTGRVDFPGGAGSVGASPGGAGDGIVNVTTAPVNTPLGTVPGTDTTVGINQQNVPVGSVTGGRGSQTGAWLGQYMNGYN